jgi:diguanylate cyclase (GGDEF)-like protein
LSPENGAVHGVFPVNDEVRAQPSDAKFARARRAKAARAGRERAPAPRVRARRLLSGSRLIVLIAVAALGATLVFAGIGYGVAERSDQRVWAEQRAALRNTIAEFRVLFGRSGALDPHFVRMVEQSARLKGLRFESDPAPGDREMQPVLDPQGRIAGFFTWDRTYPMAATMNRLMPLIGGIALVLVGFAGFALRQLNHAREELAASEEAARRAADSDKLTGLPNHAKTLEFLDLSLAERADEEVVSFALVELDGMADVNAQLGVLGADEFVVAVARRLGEALPEQAVCGRISGEQFAVLLSASPAIGLGHMLREAVAAVARPLWIDRPVRANAHAGFAQAPRDALTRGELVRRAGLALRAATRKGPGSVVGVDDALDTMSKDRKFIQRELPRALAAGELELHYQPIVTAGGARIVGVEALLRWTHAERGPIGPAQFIPVAEQMGLMDALGAFVLKRALADAPRWPDLYVAVNLSPLQVRDASIVATVRAALADSGIEPSRLMLEITEGVLIDNPDEMLERIGDLHDLGVRIALDDFGSGYSNLGYLQRFPIDKLKIDKSFVDALGASSNGGVIIHAIVALGRALGLTVLVEGVETEQQRVLLRLAGCDEMQGFLFARPAPARVIDRLLEQAKPAAARRGGAA